MKKVRVMCCCLMLAASMSCSIDQQTAMIGTQWPEINDPMFQASRAEIDRKPNSPAGYVNLAAAYMKQARRTGEFALNENAQRAVTRALELDANNIPARKLESSLHLANHRFHQAIDAAKKLEAELPSDSFVYGVLADAYVEIGEYKNAVTAAQKMVDLKPGTASYSRVAQLRSLHGDHGGAVEMFTRAARSADPNDIETRSWCLVQLGDEYWKHGDYSIAEKIYDEALAINPGYFLAIVSKGRVRASAGDIASAEQLLLDVQTTLPNANATLLLGDIYWQRGDVEKANRQYEQFDAMQAKLGDAADHRRLVISWADRGKIDDALEMARREYAAEKSIYSADLLAWSLFRAGNVAEALSYSREAIRLNTVDARLLFHAGMIAKANGDRREARRLLKAALKLSPAFDLLNAPEARNALAELG